MAERWRGKGNEKVACHLEEHIEECLTCLAFPESHRRRIRTTNGLERLNQEIKRRTRVVRIFPNPEACLRLVTALCVEQSEEMGYGQTLPGHARTRRTTPRKAGSPGGEAHAALERGSTLEETTELLGLDRRSCAIQGSGQPSKEHLAPL